jgi:hypothetical protein
MRANGMLARILVRFGNALDGECDCRLGRGRAGGLTLPSECVSLNRPVFEDSIHPRGRCGGGNAGAGISTAWLCRSQSLCGNLPRSVDPILNIFQVLLELDGADGAERLRRWFTCYEPPDVIDRLLKYSCLRMKIQESKTPTTIARRKT